MEGQGLAEVPNPSALFLTHRGEPVSGTSVFPAIEGSRACPRRDPGVDRSAGDRSHTAKGGRRMGQRPACHDFPPSLKRAAASFSPWPRSISTLRAVTG